MSDDIFSRDRLAGNDPQVLARAKVAVIGAGAAGQNTVLALALLGVGTVAIADLDRFEGHNATRSPFYRHGARKAPAVARGFVSFATNDHPRAYAWPGPAEEVGDLVGAWANVIVSCADRNSARRYASDVARRYGRPLVETGFDAARLSVSAFPSDPGGACWSCERSRVTDARDRGLCTLYAQRVEERGAVPSIQTVAQAAGALTAEAAVGFLHGRGPTTATRLTMDIGTWRSVVTEVTRNPDCEGRHEPEDRTPTPLSTLPSTASELRVTLADLGIPQASIRLAEPWVESLPCSECGARVWVGAWRSDVRSPPRCRGTCRERTRPAAARIHAVLPHSDRVGLKRLCVGAGTVLEVEDAGGEEHLVRLPGDLESSFKTFERGPGRRSYPKSPRR